MNILQRIVESTKLRVEKDKKLGLPEIMLPARPPFSLEKALGGGEMSFICEVKKASPSKGVIAQDFPYVDIARQYEAAGASAISVLTEPEFFLGSDQYLSEIRRAVETPLLRKDFVIDSFQIEQASRLGADGVLLICAILSPNQLSEYIRCADSFGLTALVEVHDEQQLSTALLAGARVIGVNNRDLRTFTVDPGNSIRLRRLAPKDVLFISESGIQTPQDVENLRSHGIDGVLVGETLMRAADKKIALDNLRGGGA